MALSYFVNEGFTNIPYVTTRYWSHKFNEDKILITTEHGAWVILSKNEFDLLRCGDLTEDLNLFRNLEEKGIIITENNNDTVVNYYQKRFHHLFNGINLHVVVPTLRCNHNCLYCHSNSKPMSAKNYDMDENTAKGIVDFILQSPASSLTIEFQGGEPLVNFPIVQYIIEYAKRKNCSKKSDEFGWYVGRKNINFNIVSNLTLMDEAILDYLIKNKVSINTSLDGPKKLHNKNRKYSGGGSYDKVVYWIDFIKREKRYPFFGAAMPTITRHSLEYSKEIVDEYMQHSLNSLFLRPLNIAGTTITAWKKIGYTPEEYIEFWKESMEYILKTNSQGTLFYNEETFSILRRIVTLKPPFNACLGSPCGACLIQAAYNQWGDVYTCDEARSNEIFKLGNTKKDSYKKVFTSGDALNFIALTSGKSALCDACEWSPYCSPCLVSSYGEQNNLISKLPKDFVCKIRKAQTEYVFKKLIFSENDKKTMLWWLSTRND